MRNAALSLFFLASIAVSAAAQVLPRPTTSRARRSTTALRVVIIRDPLAPVVTVEENYLVGANETPPGFPGMAHAQEHMAFRGCAGVSADQTAAIFAQLGGFGNADTQQNITQYFTTVPAADLDVALAPRRRLHAGRRRLAGRMGAGEGRHRTGGRARSVGADLQVHHAPERGPVRRHAVRARRARHARVVREDDRRDAQGVLPNWYAPNNAILVVAGDVDPAATLAKIKELYGAIPRRPVGARPPVTLQPVKPESFTLDSNLPYTLAFISYRLPGTESADFAAARVMADVLASQRGDLYALVPAGKALFAQFELAETYPKASVGFSVAALPASTAPTDVVASMRSIVAGYVRAGFPAELVDAAKRSEIASAEFRRNSIPDLAAVWSQALAAEGRTSPDEDVDAIRRVTVADVNRVARRYLVGRELGHRDAGAEADRRAGLGEGIRRQRAVDVRADQAGGAARRGPSRRWRRCACRRWRPRGPTRRCPTSCASSSRPRRPARRSRCSATSVTNRRCRSLRARTAWPTSSTSCSRTARRRSIASRFRKRSTTSPRTRRRDTTSRCEC